MYFSKIDWAPSETLFKIGDFGIHYYSLMFIIAFSLGYYLMKNIFNDEEKHFIKNTLIKSSNWLKNHKYPSVQNQMIASMNALYFSSMVLKDSDLFEDYKSRKKEVSQNTVTVRKLGSDKQEEMKRDDIIKTMLDLNKLPLN